MTKSHVIPVKQAVLYRSEQPDNRPSMHKQVFELDEWAVIFRRKIMARYSDELEGAEYSAALRPALHDCIDKVTPAMDIAVYDLACLSRDVSTLVTLECEISRRGGRLVVLKDTDLFTAQEIKLYHLFSMYEQARRSFAKEMARSRKIRPTQTGLNSRIPPYGYQRVKQGSRWVLTPDPVEQRRVRDIKKLSEAGDGSGAIARQLNHLGWLGREKRQWNSAMILRILQMDELEILSEDLEDLVRTRQSPDPGYWRHTDGDQVGSLFP